jgi:hypothetical protein
MSKKLCKYPEKKETPITHSHLLDVSLSGPPPCEESREWRAISMLVTEVFGLLGFDLCGTETGRKGLIGLGFLGFKRGFLGFLLTVPDQQQQTNSNKVCGVL